MKKILITFISALMLSSLVHAKVHDGIEVKVQPVKNSLGNDQDVYVKVSYHNHSNQPVEILRWYLPDEKGQLEEGIFQITRDGETVDFMGPHYKRPAPTKADYVTLEAHGRLTYTVELSAIYDFSEAGYYQVDMSVSNLALFDHTSKANGKSGMNAMKSAESASVYLAKVRAGKGCNPRKQDCGGGGGGTGDVSFSGACSNSEQSSILSALDAAKNMANDSVSYLNGSAGSRYTTWFGAYTSTRWNTATSHFDSIKDALDNKPKTFDCSCNQSYYAYVYPNQPYKVYLCRAFWSAPTTGTDSKGGTIIHEMSHFNAVAGTDDIVYGQSGAKNLAISDPNGALNNADSHEYFAENNPRLN